MKIEQLRFCNLNSLVGEWRVDFTTAEFRDDGLFAIIGPTGAGKTTLLDAICLALYGRTPRLDRVTKNDNEIMARQTGECFAEVTFATREGRFRCHWEQHRSRRKSNGELQQPRHELVDAETGKVLESRLKDVETRVPELTGMDFDRFTRSMMLAQGGFAAFLKASADERAPVLEQLTGTAIYSQISRQVHELRAVERKQLEWLESGLQGLVVLSEDEANILQRDIQRQDAAIVQDQKVLDQTRVALAWRQQQARLQETAKQLQNSQQLCQERLQAFEPQAQLLARAQRALMLAESFGALQGVRGRQQETVIALQQRRVRRPDVEREYQDALQQWHSRRDHAESLREQWRQLQPVVQQARGLDQSLLERERELADATVLQRREQQLLDGMTQELQTSRAALASEQQQQRQVDELVTEHAIDGGLVGELAGLTEHTQTLVGLVQRCEQGRQRLRQLLSSHDAMQVQWHELRGLSDGDLAAHDNLRHQLLQSQARLDALRQGGRGQQCGDELQQRMARHAVLESLLRLAEQRLQLQRRSAEVQQTLAAGSLQQHQLASRQQMAFSRVESLQLRLDAQQMSRSVRRAVANLDAHRQQLRDGEACPLCGSLEHPFMRDQLMPRDVSDKELEESRVDHSRAQQEEMSLRVELAAVEEGLRLAQLQLQRIEQEYAGLLEPMLTLWERLDNTDMPDDGELQEWLTIQRDDNSARIAALQQHMSDQALVQDEIERRQADVNRLAERVTASQARQQELLIRLDEVRGQCEQARQQLVQDEGSWQQHQIVWEQRIGAYGVLSSESPQQALVVLRQRAQQWQAWQDEQRQRATRLERLAAEVQERQQQLQVQQQRLAQLNQVLSDKQQAREFLQLQRGALLEGQSVTEVDQHWQVRLLGAEQALDLSNRTLQQQTLVWEQLVAAIAENEVILERIGAGLEQMESEFRIGCQQAGFESEADFVSARMDDELREQLQSQGDGLEQEWSRLQYQAREVQQQLQVLQEQALATEELVEIEARLQGLQASVAEQQQMLGGLRERWLANEALLVEREEHIRALQKQRQVCDDWDALHALIGSADGKKYRNFAQGLTFDGLIGHANRQLQSMGDRYLLVRDSVQPLELNVMDNWQAGEVRSTRNLSGGEGFLISLALALGLSQMASRNVRVDSLFLDEGFGTLDDDALEVAINTLAALKGEDKLIGVISHVAALKERIATRIEVLPGRDGRSSLRGPGCKALG